MCLLYLCGAMTAVAAKGAEPIGRIGGRAAGTLSRNGNGPSCNRRGLFGKKVTKKGNWTCEENLARSNHPSAPNLSRG
jgi:hypothetical protein